jgi:hypothetical protein
VLPVWGYKERKTLKCSSCHKEVAETQHTIDGYVVGYYGLFTTRAEKVGKSREGDDICKGWMEAENLTCVECGGNSEST